MDVLNNFLLPIYQEIFLFQQDNAPIHVSNYSKTWIKNNQIKILDWPAYSPDLNPIENVWGLLARNVYEDGKQFDVVEELK